MDKGENQKKNILVIGGAGFVGSHLCEELVRDHSVICLDNFSTGEERNIDHLLAEPNFRLIKHDIVEPIDLLKFPELNNLKIEFLGIQEVYNLACPTSPKNFEQNRLASLLANTYGTKNALDLAVRHKSKFLHFSSSVVYGPRPGDGHRIQETELGQVDQLSERACYDEGKRYAETLVNDYRRVHGLDTKIMRLFRTYGPKMKLDDNQMIPDFVAAALENRDLVIYGTPDFSSSFCYVGDAVDAALKLMNKTITEPINIGSDLDIKFSDLAEKIIKLTGATSKIVFQNEVSFMSRLALPDIAKARNTLGWMPIVTLEKGLEQTIYDLRASKGVIGFRNTV